MIQRFQRLLSRRIMRYVLVGGSVYVLELLIILGGQSAGLSDVWAVAVAFWTGLVVSFLLQKFVTFGDMRTHRAIVLKQFTAVTVLVLWNFFFTIAVTKLLSAYLPAVITRTIALLITTIWNFYLYKTSIFRSDTNPLY